MTTWCDRSVKISQSYGIQSPGLDGVSWTPDDVEVTASLYVNVIRGHQPHGPYYLIAYCAGGPFAYEVARQLMSAGETVSFLGFIDYKAPKQEIRSTFWSCYRYVCDNAGGAVAHHAPASGAPAREKKRCLYSALPGFLHQKSTQAACGGRLLAIGSISYGCRSSLECRIIP